MVSQDLSSQINFKAVIIIGPTASGKSALAHQIYDYFKEKHVKFAIVNLDAFQIYKHVTAGTAKPSFAEQNKYNYYCIDLLPPDAAMDANLYAKLIHTQCQELYNKGVIPLCVGGSGLYLRAFLHGLDSLPGRDEAIRTKIRQMAASYGWPHCHSELAKVDPIRASELHPNDKTRIERALELYYLLGKPMSSLRSKTSNLGEQSTLFPSFLIHLEPNESALKEKIKTRVPLLFAQNWISEVTNLLDNYGEQLLNFNSMKAIGYQEIINFILEEKKCNEKLDSLSAPPELLERISTLTWQYAKRQLTWNAKEKKDVIVTLNSKNEFENINLLIQQWLKENKLLKR
ncbi:tRNA (adenosine(37)-N6)-dimethylallyltransferase MiaA [Pigmentibacter sp. JX0631]|uniref:tRNA (adenosine(37)-N6)-dimethylallyltransferase MiaA n=1 Tax=Pigmentibacter sp. JX0631 TaxID=2976982 RepID=UPI002468565F|nr:tRNA (adenosine(37)-N6)-dimethylallyltransferase MiaA [Pigmentibacter sp. JX0631]WGL59615.1 tRNA (adenosine(37)-N6)-dimethylallyltransferase MiaA [Pigmentibacter sp. JX0631]